MVLNIGSSAILRPALQIRNHFVHNVAEFVPQFINVGDVVINFSNHLSVLAHVWLIGFGIILEHVVISS